MIAALITFLVMRGQQCPDPRAHGCKVCGCKGHHTARQPRPFSPYRQHRAGRMARFFIRNVARAF